MLRVALRSLVAHRARLFLTAASAVLGVAFVAGMLMLTSALDRTFTDIFTSTATDVQITAESALDSDEGSEEPGTTGLVPDSVVATVSKVPGVADAAGVVTAPGLALLDDSGDVVGGQGPPTLGMAWLANPALSNASITQGREPQRSGELVVDELTFPKLNKPLGSTIEVVAPDARITAAVVGVFRLGDAGGLAGLTLAAFVPDQAQQLLTAPGQWTAVVAEVAEGTSNADVAQRIAEQLGVGYDVQTREQQISGAVTDLRQGLGFITTIIGVFAGIALFVAAFLIYNTFAMLIAQRGRELALLRAVGALRRQILGSVMVEAVLISLISAALGVALGYVLAVGLKALLNLIGLQLSVGVSVNAKAVAWALTLSLLVTCVSALLPAFRASRTAPVAALRDAGRPAEVVGRVRTAVGLILGSVCGWQIWQAYGGQVDAQVTAWSSAGLLLAGILLGPALAKGFAAATTRLLARLGGVPGRVAGRNAARAPRRVAATASALMIGLALVSGVSVIVASAQQSLADLVDRTFVGDLLITRDGRAFSPAVAAQVAQVPGVGLVVQQTSGPAELDGSPVRVGAVDLIGNLPGLDPSIAASPEELIAGRAVMGTTAATEFGLAPGDRIDLLLPSGGELALIVAAVVEDNPLLGDLVVPMAEYRAAGGEPDDRAVFVAFDGSVPRAEAEDAVRDVVAANPLLSVYSQAELKDRQQKQLDQLLYLVYAMLGLSIIIAALGVVNTMALSVIERTREVGLLRAVGASRSQVRRMVRWEAVLVSTLGGILGILIGVLVGGALRRSLADDGLEALAVPWELLAWVFAGAVLIGIVGAVLPARRASRMDILRALGTE